MLWKMLSKYLFLSFWKLKVKVFHMVFHRLWKTMWNLKYCFKCLFFNYLQVLSLVETGGRLTYR
jgi:hypothetical protein